MITSMANGRIRQLQKWQKKKKAREEDGVFLVEGIRMAVEAPQEQIKEIYLSESFAGKKEHEALINSWTDRNITLLSDAVFSHVSDTLAPQGVLLVMEAKQWGEDEFLGNGKQPPLLMLLENMQDPGNLGTVLRAGEAAGVTGVILSRDSVDIYNPKVIRSTMGAIYRMPCRYVDSLTESVEMQREKGIRSYAAWLPGSVSYDREDYRGGTAFLIGNEGNGLLEQTALAADARIRIPMCGQVESLNAAVAASVLMFEAARQRRE